MPGLARYDSTFLYFTFLKVLPSLQSPFFDGNRPFRFFLFFDDFLPASPSVFPPPDSLPFILSPISLLPLLRQPFLVGFPLLRPLKAAAPPGQ